MEQVACGLCSGELEAAEDDGEWGGRGWSGQQSVQADSVRGPAKMAAAAAALCGEWWESDGRSGELPQLADQGASHAARSTQPMGGGLLSCLAPHTGPLRGAPPCSTRLAATRTHPVPQN